MSYLDDYIVFMFNLISVNINEKTVFSSLIYRAILGSAVLKSCVRVHQLESQS